MSVWHPALHSTELDELFEWGNAGEAISIQASHTALLEVTKTS